MRPYRVNQVCMILHDLLFPSCFQADAVDSQKLLRWDRKEITSVSWHSGFDVRGEKGGKISPCQFLAALIEVPVGQMTDSRLINASSACRQSKLIGAEVRQLMQLEALIGIGQRQRLGAALHHFFLRNVFIWFGFAANATMYQYHCIAWRISAGFPYVLQYSLFHQLFPNKLLKNVKCMCLFLIQKLLLTLLE